MSARYRFEIDGTDGGGWLLRLMAEGADGEVEMGGGCYPPDGYADALEQGQDWVTAQSFREVGNSESVA